MKNAIILHGTGCNPRSYWIPYIKKYLEKNGYDVWVPQLPDSENPDLKKQLPFILANGKFNKDTILIGHSAGGPLAISVLEHISVKINKAILVAGYARIKGSKKPEKILQKEYDWNKVKTNVKDMIFINSDNDPWGCNDVEGRYMLDNIGGILIMPYGEGHMGSDSFKQPYKEFPLLKRLLP